MSKGVTEPKTETGRKFLADYIAEHDEDEREDFEVALKIAGLRDLIVKIEEEAAEGGK